jgi:uncharacterized surface protein with fasciclin (FAS1) repeats
MKTNKISIVSLFLIFAILLQSCNSDNEFKQEQVTTSTVIKSNAQLQSLASALESTGLLATFDGQGEYTLFAPSDAAFQQFLSENGYASLNDVPSVILSEILLNHVLVGKYRDTDLPGTGYINTLAKGFASDTNTLSMYIQRNSIVKLNNESTVTLANISTSNGIIHIVDKVIKLPTVYDHLQANVNFSNLVTALNRTDQPDFAGILSGSSSIYTVFAPYNSGFSDFLSEYGFSDLNAVPQMALEKTLKYHVVVGSNVLSNTLVNSQVISTFANQNFTVKVNSQGINFKDYNNKESNLSPNIKDIQCVNGIIHGIDLVLVPNLN